MISILLEISIIVLGLIGIAISIAIVPIPYSWVLCAVSGMLVGSWLYELSKDLKYWRK